MSNELFENKRIAATPIILVLVLILLYGLIQAVFFECKFGFAGCEPFHVNYIAPLNSQEPLDDTGGLLMGQKPEDLENIRALIAERYSGRLIWVFLLGVNIILCISTLTVSITLIYKSPGFLKEKPTQRVIILIGLSFLFSIILWAVPNTVSIYMQEAMKSTIAKGTGGMPIVFDVTRFINAFTFLAAFSILFATCSILLTQEDIAHSRTSNAEMAAAEEVGDEANEPRAELYNRLAPVADQLKDLRLGLYASTLLLIVGVLRVSAIANWSLAFVSQDAVKSATVFYNTIVTITGGFYTLILVAIFPPAIYILERRAQAVTKESRLPPDERKGILVGTGLTYSFREAFPRVVAILGPLLAGPIGDLFRSLLT